MGKTKSQKDVMLADIKSSFASANLVMVIDYHGLTVAEITNLRRKLREKGGSCTVAKNTLFKIAVGDDENWQAMESLLKGSNAVIFLGEDMGAGIKAYQEFQKTSKKTEMRGGVLEGRLLSDKDLKAIADLPTKEQLYAQIAGAINGVATKVAVGIKEVPASIGRGIKAMSEKDAA